MQAKRYGLESVRRGVSRRRIIGAGALGATASALAACGNRSTKAPSPATTQGKPKLGGSVSLRVANDPFDWDMSYAGKSIPNDTGSALAYDSLLGFKSGPDVKYGDSILQPELAQRWETPDAQTYTFHLRPGVKFANQPPINGRDLSSNDIKWSYEYWSRSGQFADKKLPPAQYASYFEGISGVDTPDASTVVVRFKQPFVPFINYTGSYFNPVVPHEIYDLDGNLHNRIVGTGPFQLDSSSSQKGSRWVWKKNPTYWDTGKPYLDEVDWLVLPDDASAAAALQSKQVDMIGVTGENYTYLSSQEVKKIAPSAVVYQYLPVGCALYINLNNKMAPLNDARVRQAISYAIDRDEFIKTLSGGNGGWALVGAFPDTFTQEEIKQIVGYDPQKAQQLLSAAGFTNGVQLEFIYPGTSYGQDYVTGIQLFQAQLKKVGINLTLKSLDKAAWTNGRKSYTYTITGGPKADLVGDVDSWLLDFFSTSKSNYSRANDPQLDSLINGERREPDATKRRDLVRQAVRLANTQAYSIGVYIGSQYYFWQPYLKGYYPNFNVNTLPETGSWVEK